MLVFARFLRISATAGGLMLAYSFMLTPAFSEEGGMTLPPTPETSSAAPGPANPAPAADVDAVSSKTPDPPDARKLSAWVKLCDHGRITGRDKTGAEVDKNVEMCVTLTEQIHPDSGLVLLAVNYQQIRLDGAERHFLTVTVPLGAAMANGAAITVFPPDLWLKAQRSEKLSAADAMRLDARTIKLAFDHCVQTGCIAEMEAGPLLTELLKSNAGMMVHTVRSPSTTVIQAVSLTGFAQVLERPATDMKQYTAAREALLQAIASQQKQAAELKRRQEEMEAAAKR